MASARSFRVPSGRRSTAPARRRRAVRRCRVLGAAAALLGLTVGLLVTAPVAGRAAPVAARDPRPNIVFVLTDDLDTSLLQYMPHVRALAARGTSFTNYVVADSWCCPSRASIFTGEFPHNTGVRNNGQDENGGFGAFHRLGDENRTFALDLHGSGYRTGFMGKYLNGYSPSRPVPDENGNPGGDNYIPPGWDEWYGLGRATSNYDYVANHNGHLEQHGHAPGDYLNTVLQKNASAFITASSKARAPFLLEVASFTPHGPYTPAPGDTDLFPGLQADRGPAWNTLPTNAPAWLGSHTPLSAAQIKTIDAAARKRAQAVQSVDRLVAHLQDVLQQAGQLQNTVFVFSSDNGYHLGQYRLGPGKLTAFDTDIRVPLVVAGPGIPVGTSAAMVQNIDLAPTFEQLGGLTPLPSVDGRSLLGLLDGSAGTWRSRAFVEHQGAPPDPHDPDQEDSGFEDPTPYEAIRGPDYTYVQYSTTNEHEYYDLRADPDQLHNVYASLSQARRNELTAAVAKLRTCAGQQCWNRARA